MSVEPMSPPRDTRYDLHSSPPPGDHLQPVENRQEIYARAVQTLVNALGGYEDVETSPGRFETIYRPGDSVLAVLKDLKKLWRKDDEDDERTVARCMIKAGLMKELIAILVECSDRGDWGRKVALVACDLIAALTWPIDVAQELKEMEDEPNVISDYASLLRAQVHYKALFLQTPKPLRCLLALMVPCLAKPKKTEKDQRIISLGLHIVRNLLAVKNVVAEGSANGEREEFGHLQSSLICQLNELTYLQLFLTIASYSDKNEFNSYNVLVLDILYLIFRSIKVQDLVQDQKRVPMASLEKLLESERKDKAIRSRHQATRHSRFGTTITVKAAEQRIILHGQNAIGEDPGRILDQVKKKHVAKTRRMDDLTQYISLSPEAMTMLQDFSQAFLESCFNIFFESVMKDIRMERPKIRPSDNVRTFYLARFFIEYLLALRHKYEDQPQKRDGLPLALVAEIAEMDSVKWLFSRLRFTMDEKPPAWTELQACVDCFTQILLLIDEMSISPNEEDLEVAEILQHQLYYNGDILDSALSVVTKYKDQSVGYLDSVVHFAYVLLRMLEKYSKTQTFMYVRKRRTARKKRKAVDGPEEGAAPIPEEYGNEEEEIDLEREKDTPSYAEHKFTFQSFEKRFAQESVVKTLLTYLERYREFEGAEELKRVVGLMHRQVVKTQAESLYYSPTTFMLFQRILDDQHALPQNPASKDLITLINFILRKYFKRVSQDPFVIVQTLTNKGRGKTKGSGGGDSDDGMGGQKKRIKEKMGPAELQFKKNKKLTWSEQMGVLIAIFLNEEKEDLIQWIISCLEIALAAREEVVLAVDGGVDVDEDQEDEVGTRRPRNFGGPSDEAIAKFAQYDLEPETDEQREMVNQNPHFRLMLKHLSFDFPPVDEDAPGPRGPTEWFLPSSITPSDITTSLGALKQFLLEPPSLEDDPKTLIQKRRAPRRRRSPSFSGIDSDTGEPRVRVKEAKKKKAVETQVYKSAAFIEDSDDEDEETTRRFYEREAELRAEMSEMASVMLSQGMMKRKRNGGKKGTTLSQMLEADDEDEVMAGSSAPPTSEPPSSRAGSSQPPMAVDEDSDSDNERPRRIARRTSTPLSDGNVPVIESESEDEPVFPKHVESESEDEPVFAGKRSASVVPSDVDSDEGGSVPPPPSSRVAKRLVIESDDDE
ncbi:hypothetical protein IAT38_003259 [Cryptococcus sp. DSM 104549]